MRGPRGPLAGWFLPVVDRLPSPVGPRARDHVADFGTAISIFERRAMWSDRVLASNSLEQVRQLVRERVSPADDVARRPPEAHERVLRLRGQHPAEVLGIRELDLVQPLGVK